MNFSARRACGDHLSAERRASVERDSYLLAAVETPRGLPGSTRTIQAGGNVAGPQVSLVRWDRPHFKADETPVKVQRHDRKKAREEALDAAYRIVDKRDGNRCRVTGVSLVAGAPNPKVRREHHHLVPRSRSRALREKPSNILLVSAFAHDLIERGWLVNEGHDANKPIFWHWSEIATSHPLKIQRHNPREDRQ
jgi:hypothetical protein